MTIDPPSNRLLLQPNEDDVALLTESGGLLPEDVEFTTFQKEGTVHHPEESGWWTWPNPLGLGSWLPHNYRNVTEGKPIYPDPDVVQVLRYEARLLGRGRPASTADRSVIRLFRLQTRESEMAAEALGLPDLPVAEGYAAWPRTFPDYASELGCDAMVYSAALYESQSGAGRTVLPRLHRPTGIGVAMIHPGIFSSPEDSRAAWHAYYDSLVDFVYRSFLSEDVSQVAFCTDSLLWPDPTSDQARLSAFAEVMRSPKNYAVFRP